MLIAKFISYFSIIIWFLPPLRQRNTKYFTFFLILALADPVTIILMYATKIYSIKISLIITYILIVSVLQHKNNLKHLSVLLSILVLLFVVDIYFTINEIFLVKVFLSSALVFIFLKETILYLNKDLKINLFLLILTFYEITIVTKFIIYITQLNLGVIYFYITTAFEIFIGIFFIIYNVNNSPNLRLFRENLEDIP